MKKTAASLFIIFCMINFSNLLAEETEYINHNQLSKYKENSFDYKICRFSLSPFSDSKSLEHSIQSKSDGPLSSEKIFFGIRKLIGQFTLEEKKSSIVSLQTPNDEESSSKNKKKFGKTALEVTGFNLTLWAFDKYIMKETWANISFKTIIQNFKDGPTWDIDPFSTNQLDHAYHGAINYSTARANGYNFFESAVWAFYGSFMWEFFLETRGALDNPPSTNDLIVNTIGGATLGEALFRASNLLIDESSRGVERVSREFFAILINPSNIFRVFSGKAFKIGNPPEKHNFSLDLPFGAYKSYPGRTNFFIAASLEYKDYLRSEHSKINPYDWFTFDVAFGIHNYKLTDVDAEICSTGVVVGKKRKHSLVGLFSVFDYIDSHAVDMISVIGAGPGFVTDSSSDSNMFFKSYGVLTLIMGASSPSFDIGEGHFGRRLNNPYYFGPGMMGRLRIEYGKKGLGSINAGYSQYWVTSIFYNANEFQSILSCSLQYDLSNKSQISIGYDYYLRHGSLNSERHTDHKSAIRALYTLKF